MLRAEQEHLVLLFMVSDDANGSPDVNKATSQQKRDFHSSLLSDFHSFDSPGGFFFYYISYPPSLICTGGNFYYHKSRNFFRSLLRPPAVLWFAEIRT